MSKKKKYVGISSILLIGVVVLLYALYVMKIGPFDGSSNKVEQNAPMTSNNADEKISVTAMEALRLGFEEAKKHTGEEPLLIDMRSKDNTNVPQEKTDGADGKRNTWYLRFGSKKGNFRIYITIENGNAITNDVRKDDNNLLRKGRYTISDINIDSPKAVKQAIEELSMQPGNPEIYKGYNFTISGFQTDPDSYDTRLLLRVTGISPNSPNSENESLRMHAFFDGKTGEMLNASEMTGYDEEGRSMWRYIEPKH
ncbi:hypothetical protein NVS47_01125 [Dehalobacterium formicoaceticum]|uniref:Uncharacterized protein n=1 Tax=Dehalobacterium formicoaceticum TaxID=51515 RepID=A0ABT1XZU2_9FIRM|nr:hypothetical protein [Dehalobacterium formicoaceticum]MCR6544131.1 hypothetical protein [Dehalobacterium formicoaceticum]